MNLLRRLWNSGNQRRALRPSVPQARPKVELLEDRTVLSTVYGLLDANVLIRFDSATPDTVTTVGTVNVGTGETLVGIDFRPRTGELIGSTVADASANNSIVRTYKINPLTAQATLIGATAAAVPGAGDVATGYDFNPTVDRIRVVNDIDENFRLNPNNGALAGDDTDLTPASTVSAIAAAYDRNFDRQTIAAPANNAVPTTLFLINRDTSSLSIQGGVDGTPSPNGGVVTDLASLGFTLDPGEDGGFDIVPGAGTGRAFAALSDTSDGLTRLYSINLAGTAGVASRIGLIGAGTSEIFSIAVQPDTILAAGVDAGSPPIVRVFDAVTNATKSTFLAYDFNFTGGVRVAVGDVTGDGVQDIITGTGPGVGPHVKVFDGVTFAEIRSFFAYAPQFVGGITVATGDLNADGFDEIIVGAGAFGHVRAFDVRTGVVEVRSFFAYPGFTGGVTVAAGDFDLDGDADIVTGAGSAASHVKVFDGLTGAETRSFLAFTNFASGVSVAVGDVNGDGRPDIVASAIGGVGAHVKAFSGVDNSEVSSFFSQAGFTGSIRVTAADTDGDGRDEIVVALPAGGQGRIRSFNALTGAVVDDFFAFAGFNGGIFVGG